MILWMLNNHEVNWIDTVFIWKEEMTPALLWFTNIEMLKLIASLSFEWGSKIKDMMCSEFLTALARKNPSFENSWPAFRKRF